MKIVIFGSGRVKFSPVHQLITGNLKEEIYE